MNYDNNMTGLIGKNDRKTEDQHPDLKGHCEINKVEMWVSGWKKQKKDGSGSFYSLRFTPKEKVTQQTSDEDIPF